MTAIKTESTVRLELNGPRKSLDSCPVLLRARLIHHVHYLSRVYLPVVSHVLLDGPIHT